MGVGRAGKHKKTNRKKVTVVEGLGAGREETSGVIRMMGLG